jgi:hypothetical protein
VNEPRRPIELGMAGVLSPDAELEDMPAPDDPRERDLSSSARRRGHDRGAGRLNCWRAAAGPEVVRRHALERDPIAPPGSPWALVRARSTAAGERHAAEDGKGILVPGSMHRTFD